MYILGDNIPQSLIFANCKKIFLHQCVMSIIKVNAFVRLSSAARLKIFRNFALPGQKKTTV